MGFELQKEEQGLGPKSIEEFADQEAGIEGGNEKRKLALEAITGGVEAIVKNPETSKQMENLLERKSDMGI